MHQETTRLREALREAQERIKWLEGILASFDVPGEPKWKLSKQQSRLLYVIAARPIVPYEAIINALYYDKADEPIAPRRTIGVVLCKLKRKLQPFGIVIHTKATIGFWIDEPSRQFVLNAQAGAKRPALPGMCSKGV